MEKLEIVDHFQKEGYSKRTIYDTINRLQLGRTIKEKKKTGRPISAITAKESVNDVLVVS